MSRTIELGMSGGSTHGSKVFTAEKIKIGKNTSADLRIEGDGVSRMHAVIRATDTDVKIEDLGSESGTYVNDQRISGSVVLAPGDRIRIGPVTLQVITL